MADYKEKLFGTIGKLSDKVKQVSESGSVREIYEGTANRAKSYSRAAKLMLEKNSTLEQLRRAYLELGKLTYERYKDSPGLFDAALFAEISELLSSIDEKDAEIRRIRSEYEGSSAAGPEDELLDFDSIVSQTEDDGQK